MASAKDVLLAQLGTGAYLFDKFTADLSDEEYFKVPVADGNHAAWNVGHIACSEDSMVEGITSGKKHIAEETHELFKGGSVCTPGATTYPTRADIDKMLHEARERTVCALKAFDDAKWEEPSPEGYPKEVFPTIGAVWGMIGAHQFWHIGELAVCRKALKKPLVLG